MMRKTVLRNWFEEHIIAVCILFTIIVIFSLVFYLYYVIVIDETISYTVIVDETIELSKTTVIGTIDSIRILNNGLTKIKLNEGSGLLGFDNLENYWIATDLNLLPSDIIKITEIRKQGIGCIYFDSEGVGHNLPSRQINIKLFGDICGKYAEYEVEKLR